MAKAKQPTAGRGTMALLRAEIAQRPSGSVFSTQDLLAEGRLGTSRSALDIALKRLADEGDLVRAGRGVFAIPESHAVLGSLPPKLESVAAAIARRSGDTMLPSGAEAANRLGLSTQVPGRPVFYTTGRASRRTAGTQRYELRHRTPRLARTTAAWYVSCSVRSAIAKRHVCASKLISPQAGCSRFCGVSQHRIAISPRRLRSVKPCRAAAILRRSRRSARDRPYDYRKGLLGRLAAPALVRPAGRGFVLLQRRDIAFEGV